MLRILLLASLLTAANPSGLTIVDQNGNPVVHASVQRIAPGQVRVSAPGYRTRVVMLRSGRHVIVLERDISIIANVRVATGTPQTLHSLPVAASALDRAAIASSPAMTADALLRELPGFDRTRSNSMFSNYGLMRVSFAGAGNDRGLVLVDGIPAQDGFGGQVDWAAYPPQTLQRVELLMGAGSALYGAGAAGGVLSMDTVAPPAVQGTAPAGTLTFDAGSHAYSRQSFVTSGWIAPHLGASVVLQQQRMQYADLPPAYASPIDREAQSDAGMAAMRLRYNVNARDALEIGARGAWDDQFEGRPNYTFSRRLSQSDLHFTHDTVQSRVQAAVFARTAFIVNVADLFPTKPGVLRYVQNVPTNERGISASWIASGGASAFEVRADARHVRGESVQYGKGGAFQSGASGSQNLYGIAVQESLRATRMQIVAGARMDTLRSYDERLSAAASPKPRGDAAVSPRLAARYDLTPHLSLRASAGAGFRPPFLNELVRGYFIGGTAYEPNPALVPERSRTYSAGIDYTSSGSRIALDAFDTGVHDAIMFRTVDPQHQLRSNVAQTATDGYTLSYERAASACARVEASVTSQYARVTSGPPAILGKRLQYVPRQSATLSYTAAAGEAALGLSLTYSGQTYADDLNAQPLGSTLLAGASVRIPFHGASLSLALENATNARYLSSIDRYGPPSVISLGISLPLAEGNNEQRNLRCTP
jgi:outer membrane receptor protein involved in Fe transport